MYYDKMSYIHGFEYCLHTALPLVLGGPCGGLPDGTGSSVLGTSSNTMVVDANLHIGFSILK